MLLHDKQEMNVIMKRFYTLLILLALFGLSLVSVAAAGYTAAIQSVSGDCKDITVSVLFTEDPEGPSTTGINIIIKTSGGDTVIDSGDGYGVKYGTPMTFNVSTS